MCGQFIEKLCLTLTPHFDISDISYEADAVFPMSSVALEGFEGV